MYNKVAKDLSTLSADMVDMVMYNIQPQKQRVGRYSLRFTVHTGWSRPVFMYITIGRQFSVKIAGTLLRPVIAMNIEPQVFEMR